MKLVPEPRRRAHPHTAKLINRLFVFFTGKGRKHKCTVASKFGDKQHVRFLLFSYRFKELYLLCFKPDTKKIFRPEVSFFSFSLFSSNSNNNFYIFL